MTRSKLKLSDSDFDLLTVLAAFIIAGCIALAR
jgi:hypothetical protein